MFRLVCGGILLFIWPLMVGCAGHRCTCSTAGSADWPTAPMPADIRSDHGELTPDLSAVPSYEAVDQLLGQAAQANQYRVLQAEEVQCLAAANSPLGNLYASESQAVRSGTNRRTRQSAQTLSAVMAYRAVDQRNKDAATALELFYSLAEIEASRSVLRETINTLDRAIGYLDELRISGLRIPMDQTALKRQKLDLIDRQIQMQTTYSQLQGRLQQLCGLEEDQSIAIWPEADLAVTIEPIDVTAAIETGLAHRADVAALRMLDGSMSVDALPAARSGIQAFSPGLGATIAARRVFGGDGDDAAELPIRQSQVSQARIETERTAVREIREAVELVEARLREVAVAGEREQVWRARVSGLKEKRQSDGVTAFDVAAGELELLAARRETIHRTIAWRIAQSKLKAAQGLLAAECCKGQP